MDVATWLKNLGLGQYEAAFRDNAINDDLLPSLTTEDLKDLGVTIVGHRRKLLDAIEALGVAPKPAAPPAAPSPPLRTFRPDAERRPITVMFCDLVGSTALASRLDAEDWRSLVNAYLDEASGAVNRLGGHVLKRLGDGLMALFGYPQAQENDAERAVRAALAIQRALGEMNARNIAKGAPQLSARIGLESGPAVVEATGEVFGEAPNVAARVQGLAEPGAVLVTANVQRQTAGLFVAEDKGAHELKGVPAPVTLYRIVRASGGRRSGARTLTPLVGREEELGVLRRRWERARAGAGQLLLIVGEPGIGKSRLVEEFRATLAETPHTFVELSSSQLLQNTPLHPIAEWGRQRFRGAETPAQQRLADLENTLRLIGLEPAEYAPLLAPLVDIPLPEERAAKLAPEELRRRQLAALVTWFLAGARSQPVALAFEDLHWADPTSLDFMQTLAERGAQAPMLILATARPEFRPPWSLRSHHNVISLSPLDRADVALMVGELAARHALSREVVEGVSERTGGVPLFVEEVTRLLLERGEAGGLQAIPPTLQQSLAARLDRLGEAREVAQIGAVLGRDFTYSLLSAIGGVEDSPLQSALDRLTGADLLIAEGAGHEATYRFKHALIQDAAYDSLLKSRRQALHRRAAEALREANAEPEAIAHHFTEAGLDDLAIEWWSKAGDQALSRSAFQEAIAHLGKAIAMADKAGGPRAAGDTVAASQRLKLQTDYGQAVMWSKGFAAEETRAVFARAAELAADAGNFAARFATAHSQWASAIVRGEQRRVRALTASFLKDAEDVGQLVEVGVARRGLAQACYLCGDFLEARTHCERAIEVCDPEREAETRQRFTDDTGPLAISLLAMTMWQLGEVERARQLINEANRRAKDLGHAPSMAHPLNWRSRLEILRGDPAAALSAAEALEALCREHGMPFWRVKAELDAEWARGRLHDAASGAQGLRRALADAAHQGMVSDAWFYTVLLAELEAKTLGADAALKRIDEALLLARQVDDRCDLPFAHLLCGELLLEHDPSNTVPAEEAFQTALAIAKEQGARSWGLRAALSLARLHQSNGRPVDAHAVLAPALECFSPTPEMLEIAEAQALLAALAGTDGVKAEATQRQRRLHLQTAYGQAMMWSKGYAAEETKAAFARAAELAAKSDNFSGRFAACHLQWSLAMVRGELKPGRELASTYLRKAEDAGRIMEAGVARRALAVMCLFSGDFIEARTHCERALEAYDPVRDREARERFSDDTGIVATSCLAVTNWYLGEVVRARELIDGASRRATELGHAPSMAQPLNMRSYLEHLRGDEAAALTAAEALEVLGRQHGMTFWRVMAGLHSACARGRLYEPIAGAAELRRALAASADQGARLGVAYFQGVLAELEAKTLGADSALARIDEALTHQGDNRCDLAYLHRLRGDILLKRDPADPAPAEEAFRTAIAIAKAQGARSYELLASLSLAKLYQSTGRPVEARAILVPALEGFAPTPEMPEIAEAQTLLAELAETDEVKNATTSRRRRLQLQTRYARAMMWAKGLGSGEAKSAFEGAQSLADGGHDIDERFETLHGLWLSNLVRGELRTAQEAAEAFRREAETLGRLTEVAFADRCLGVISFSRGDLLTARAHLEEALRLYDPERDRETKLRYGLDTHFGATVTLAPVTLMLGDIEGARKLIEEAVARAVGSGDVQDLVNAYNFKALNEVMLGDAEAALRTGQALADLHQKHQTRSWSVGLAFAWARARLGDRKTGIAELRRAIAANMEDTRVGIPLFQGRLAELEADEGDFEGALARIDEALALTREMGAHSTDSFLHRLRGDILLKRDPTNPAPAEETLRTALAIAQQQSGRLRVLGAALSLAKLYQSTGRSAEAHTILAPTLEGFAPTAEMPEIAEAWALLERLAYARFER